MILQYLSAKILNGYDIQIVLLSFRRLFVLQTDGLAVGAPKFSIFAETYIQCKEHKQIYVYVLHVYSKQFFINQQLLIWSWCKILCLCPRYLTETYIHLMSLHDY
jgi:hypothetical protein